MEDVASRVDDEGEEAGAASQVFSHANGDGRSLGEALPTFGIVDKKGVFEPNGLDGRDSFSDLESGADIEFPVAVDHDVVVPTDGFAAVFEALGDVDEFLGSEETIAAIAGAVFGGIGVGEAELVAGKTGRVLFGFVGPFAAGGLVEHVAGGSVVIDANPVAELATEQSGGGFAEEFAGEVPEGHVDATGGAEEVVRGAVGASAGKARGAFAELGEDDVDLQWILADEPRLEAEDLLLHADAGAAVGFADAVDAVVGGDFDERVGAAAGHHHYLHVADLEAARLGGRPGQ